MLFMKSISLFIFLISLIINPAYNQILTLTNARSTSLANATAALNDDVWTALNNPAGIRGIQKHALGVSILRPFFLKGLNQATLAYVQPLPKIHSAALSLSTIHFGDYANNLIASTYAFTIYNKFHFATRLNLHQLSITNYLNTKTVFLDIGFQTPISEKLYFGAVVRNINQAHVINENNNVLPTTLSVGTTYRPSDKVLLTADIQKTSSFDASYRLGIEYLPIEYFKIRIGASNAPITFNVGIGYIYKKLSFDIATQHHELLGFSPIFSVGYGF